MSEDGPVELADYEIPLYWLPIFYRREGEQLPRHTVRVGDAMKDKAGL
jgi:hypothetical protein